MPLPDKVSGRYVHLDIHGCQPCINMEKVIVNAGFKVWIMFMMKVALLLAVNDSMHAFHSGKCV